MSSVENRQEELRQIRDRAQRQAGERWPGQGEMPSEPLELIAYWLERERLANDEVVAAIDIARAAGAKWWEIGAAMGRTSEAARAFHQYHRRQAQG